MDYLCMRARIFGMSLIVFLVSFALNADVQSPRERWYVFSMGGIPVGYVVEDWKDLETRTEVSATLTRLGKSIEMRFETTATETAAGDLISLKHEVVMSKQPSHLEARVEGEKIRILSPPHERVIERGSQPILGPQAVARLSAERLRSEGDSLKYAVFSPELQRVVGVTRTLVRKGESMCAASASRVTEAIEGLTAPRTVWIDSTGRAIADSMAGPFGEMTTCRSTRETALAATGTLPDDVYEKTLAKANVRFGDPFAVNRVILEVTRHDDTQPLPPLSTHNQKIIARDDDRVIVEVRRDGGPAIAAADFLEPNALVESNHPDIVRIAGELKRDDDRATAHELTRWVAENLSMDAGIVLAPASELIRDRKATCMGYATLLATLGRAAGIPSRIAMGLIYYGGIWGGHAWTEMIVDGRWLPLDAAIYAPGTASAARLAVGASSFADGGGDLYIESGTLFGRAAVRVIEYETDRTIRVAADDKPYRLERSAYMNPGLGLRVPLKEWTVAKADATWPSTLVVSFRRGENLVELHHRPRHPNRPLEHKGDAMFVDAKGGMLLVWTASGPEAGRALRQLID